MLAKDIKNGYVVVHNGDPIVIEKISVQSPSARGGATIYKFRGRNAISKQKVDISLKGTESLDEADFQKRSVNFMYADATHLHFLDQTDFQQYSLEMGDIENERMYIKEGSEGIVALIYNEGCIGLQMPSAVELQITQCDPGVKGNSATSRTKSAKLETGLEIQVPEYMKEGETVKVDTRTAAYLSRA